MRGFVKHKPLLSFSVFIVVGTWISMAVIIALVPVDPIEGPQFVHVALVFFVASPSVSGLVFTLLVRKSLIASTAIGEGSISLTSVYR